MKASVWLWIANFALVRLTYTLGGPALAVGAWAGLGLLITVGQVTARRRKERRKELLTRLASDMRAVTRRDA